MTTDELRAKFEAALREEIIVGCDEVIRRVGNGYENINLNLAWHMYQAAHASRADEVEALKHQLQLFRTVNS